MSLIDMFNCCPCGHLVQLKRLSTERVNFAQCTLASITASKLICYVYSIQFNRLYWPECHTNNTAKASRITVNNNMKKLLLIDKIVH